MNKRDLLKKVYNLKNNIIVSGRINSRKTYGVMYSHDASIDKSKVSFTTWMKSISAGDIPQMYFGLYKSTFHGGEKRWRHIECIWSSTLL